MSRNHSNSRVRFKAAAVALGVGLTASPAAAVTFGARSCSGSYPYVQTYTFSSGKTVHVQISGGTVKSKSFSNGSDIIHRYYTSGLSSVTDSYASTTGSFQSTGNGVTCTT
ncbi:MAG: hypothetical protein QM677_06740 [Microbacterium sp.]